jgi:hypothetical protein
MLDLPLWVQVAVTFSLVLSLVSASTTMSNVRSLARVGVYRFVDQCNARTDAQPLVIVKENRRRPLAVLDAEHFFDLLRLTALTTGADNETHGHTRHASETGTSD